VKERSVVNAALLRSLFRLSVYLSACNALEVCIKRGHFADCSIYLTAKDLIRFLKKQRKIIGNHFLRGRGAVM